MSYFFKHNTNIYISKETYTNANASNTVFLNVKDFSYNQASSITKVGRNTLDPNQERTVDPYLSTVSPVSFSLTTYILPVDGNPVTSPEEYLWTSLMGADGQITSGPTSSVIDFSDGNVPNLQELTIWFLDPLNTEGNNRLDNAIIDSAEIDFDINGIAEIKWEGRALSLVEYNTEPASFTDYTAETNFLKNKLSTLSVSRSTAFTMALTGGSIKIENNNTFYSRTRLGETTVPVGHYTGNREINGELNVYLRTGNSTSADLFNEILTNASLNTYEDTLANITINIGASSSSSVLDDITVVGSFSDAADSGTTISDNVPSGIQPGDLIVAVIIANNNNNIITSQDGFDPIYYQGNWSRAPNTGGSSYGIYARIADGSETGTFDWTISTSNRYALVGQVLRGAKTDGTATQAFDVLPSGSTENSGTGGATHTANSINTTYNKSRAFAAFMMDTPTTANYSNYTNSYTDEIEAPTNLGQPLAMSTRVHTTSGSTGSVNATSSHTTDEWVAQHFAVRAATVSGAATEPNVQINIPQVLFDIPEKNFDDVITLSLPFIAKEESGNYCTVTYNIP